MILEIRYNYNCTYTGFSGQAKTESWESQIVGENEVTLITRDLTEPRAYFVHFGEERHMIVHGVYLAVVKSKLNSDENK